MKTILISTSLIIVLNFQVFSQDSIWPIVYPNNIIHSLSESNDHGYLFGGTNEVKFGTGYGMIKKIDINGNHLWQINIEYLAPNNGTSINGISQTYDGGYVVSGFTRKFGYGKAFVIKLNACAEKEWSKVFRASDTVQSGCEIYELLSGNYLIRVGRGSSLEKSIWIFKLSPKGDIIWKKYYADDWEPGPWSNELSYDFVPDNNGDFIITGDYFKAQPGCDTSTRWQRPMFIKIDSSGNELWHLVYGLSDFYVGTTISTTCDTEGNVYSAGWNSGAPGRPPSLYKLNKEGDFINYTNLPYISDSIVVGRADDVSVLNDTTLYILGGWEDSNDSLYYYAFKADTSCNITKRTLLNNHGNYQGHSLITFDNKYVAANYVMNYTTNILDTHLWKLNSNLDFDTIYTQPLIYDSLCPYQIVSDTIELDTTTVNLDELARNIVPMSIYPNPAKNKVRLEINIVKMKERQLTVLNLKGQQVYNATIGPGRANHDIDVSLWEDGLYVFNLIEGEQVLQTEKVLIVH